MSRNSRKSSAHVLVKSSAVVFLLAFAIKSYLHAEPGLIYTVAIAATMLAAFLIIILINYDEFQKYAFIPVILISLNEIYKRLSAGVDVSDSLYFLAFILIAVYFMVRSQKKKSKSQKS